MGFHEIIQEIWNDRVNSRYLYRGMSMKDLVDPLDPNHDPFEEIRQQLFALLGVLRELLGAGFRFRFREEHFGEVCWHELQDIVAWTRRDLQDTGIDFTSHRETAREYSDCYHGSQLKENLRYIADHLPEHREDPAIRTLMTEERWALLSDVSDWISTPSREHRRIVISVRRSCPLFASDNNLLPVGGPKHFQHSIERALINRGLEKTAENISQMLPDEEYGFDVRLRVPLPLEHIEKVEETL